MSNEPNPPGPVRDIAGAALVLATTGVLALYGVIEGEAALVIIAGVAIGLGVYRRRGV